MKLAIDPGHGYSNVKGGVYDPGAVSGGIAEADVALQWAMTLAWVCYLHGIDFYLTRRDDRAATPVWARDDWAEREGCTHFISIHANAAGVLASGTETFYRDAQDKAFAQVVQNCAMRAMQGKNRGLKHESATRHKRLAVFNFDGPACLLETGFITNPGDRKKICSRDVRLKFAEELVAWMKARS